ncbi:MAG: site-specific tyrosine recombinase XerD [Bacteroidales bacterium]|nr:site-specific tyrosine recombinase XerD [Bacteroidales bacterium]
MDWEDALKQFEQYLKFEKSFSVNTISAYRNDVQKLSLFMNEEFPGVSPTEVTADHLRLFLSRMNGGKMGARSQAQFLSGLRTFYKYWMLEQAVDVNPVENLDYPKLGRPLPEVLNLEEIDALLGAIDLSKPEGPRNKAILELLYSCGIRVSELISLKISDLFFDEEMIRVIGKGNKQRLIPIGGNAMKEIRSYLQYNRTQINPDKKAVDILFLNRRGKPLSRVMIFTIIRQLAEKAGVQKKIGPHTFRHSFATHLVQGGADLRSVQAMLGHESIATTEVYTHLDRSFLRQTLVEFHPLSKKHRPS